MAEGRRRKIQNDTSNPKRRKIQEYYSDADSSDEYEGMHQPSILEQLKRILDHEYKDGPQIIRELIQNAEDAGANEINILYYASDEREDGDELSKYFSGPILCVHNDGIFTEKDWTGIKSIATSVKEKDARKLGKFGLGFKSVFHLTDNPVILSGDQLLIIDPFRGKSNGNLVCRTIKLKKLRKKHQYKAAWKKLRDVLNSLKVQKFGSNLDVIQRGLDYQCSLFLFPLRKRPSDDLSDKIYDKKKVLRLFEAFTTEGSKCLIFLKSLTKIEMFYDDCLYYSVEMKFGSDIIEKERAKFKDEVKNCYGKCEDLKLPSEHRSVCFDAKVEEIKKASGKGRCFHTITKEWIVFNFIIGQKAHSSKMTRLLKEDNINCLPIVGFSFPKNYDKFLSGIFCFLPVPQDKDGDSTCLPMHVNGYFAISPDRRHIDLKESLMPDKESEWNLCLVTEVLPLAFAECIQSLIQREDFSYDRLPVYEKVTSEWKLLLRPLFQMVLDLAIFKTKSGKYIDIQTAVFSLYETHSKTIKNVPPWQCKAVETLLLECEPHFVVLPQHMKCIMKHPDCLPDNKAVKTVTPSFVREIIGKHHTQFKEMKAAEKNEILQYVTLDECFEYLIDFEIIPVNHENTFQNLKRNTTISSFTDKVFLTSEDERKVLPGLEKHLFTEVPDNELFKCLNKIAKTGKYNIQRLEEKDLPMLLEKSIQSSCLQEYDGFRPCKTFISSVSQWLKDVWSLINMQCQSSLSKFMRFENVPIIQHASCLYPPRKLFINKRSDDPLPKEVIEILKVFHIPVLQLETETKLSLLFNKYIFPPDAHNVNHILESKWQRHDITDKEIEVFNHSLSEKAKDTFVQFLSKMSPTKTGTCYFLEKLRMIKVVQHGKESSYFTLERLRHKGISSMPELQIEILPPFSIISHKCEPLATLLKCHTLSEQEIYKAVLDKMSDQTEYSVNEIKMFMNSFLTDVVPTLRKSVQQCLFPTASKVKFVMFHNNNDEKFAVKDLFEKKKVLEELFFNQNCKFAKDAYNISKKVLAGMKIVGLKSEESLTFADLEDVARHIDVVKDTKMKKRKVENFLHFLGQIPDEILHKNINKMKHIKCIPVLTSPQKDFPKEMKWYGNGVDFCSPIECFDITFSNIVGSVAFIQDTKLSNSLKTAMDLPRIPSLALVSKQLEVVEKTKNNQIRLENMLFTIYEFLSKQDAKECKTFLQNSKMWTGNKLVNPSYIYLNSIGKLNFEPYFYELSSKWKDSYENLYLSLGCICTMDEECILSVQGTISKKCSKQTQSNTEDDLDILVGILTYFSGKGGEEFSKYKDRLLVPLETQSTVELRLLPIEECTYKDGCVFSSDVDTDVDMNFVHERISSSLAKKLGVLSETKRILNENEITDVVSNCGQREDFIDRLSAILDGYTDGLAIPKELIQNADDANASVVKFVYDKRDFQKRANKTLIDIGMTPCQGPSLLIYNDAKFSENDFQNLTKTNAGTKAKVSGKIGKFGLGFCSVYNITDVPSIVSGDSLMIFDPLTVHLDKILTDKNNPGIRLKNLWKKQRLLKRWKNQLEPYNNVFGCDFSLQTSQSNYNGTLIRLPLRQNLSKISKKYTHNDISKLFEMIMEQAGNLLVFLQNVKAIELYCIDDCHKPHEPLLIYRVDKSPSNLPNVIEMAVARFRAKEEMEYSEKFRIRVNINKQSTTEAMGKSFKMKHILPVTEWQVTWTLSSIPFEDSKMPLASIAMPLSFDLKGLNKAPMGFKPSSEIFCFLPLPMEGKERSLDLPVYLNGYFAVDSNRKSLAVRSSDNVHNVKSNWNEYILREPCCLAYLKLLGDLHIKESKWDNFSMYWPSSGKNSNFQILAIAFYERILQSEYKVFVKNSTKFSFHQCKFLNMRLRYSSVGEIAFKFMDHIYKDKIVMDVSKQTYKELYKANKALFEENSVSEFDFFNELFFPNIMCQYWKSLTEERNKLTMFVLYHEDNTIKDLAKHHACIPVQESKMLRKPGELADPKSLISDMFQIRDKRFPSTKFQTKKIQLILLELGMMDSTLPDDMILKQTEGISAGETWKQLQCLLVYFSKKENQGQLRRIKFEIQNIPFLPVMEKPPAWPLSEWFGKQRYAVPKCMFFPEAKNLIGCVCNVLDEKLIPYTKVLEELGIYKKCNVPSHLVLQQLECISKANKMHKATQIQRVMDDIFQYFEELHFDEDVLKNLETFKCKDVIYVNNVFTKPNRCCKTKIADLSPFLFSVDFHMKRQYPKVLNALCVEKEFPSSKFIDILKEQSLKLLGKKLNKKTLMLIQNTLEELCKICERTGKMCEVEPMQLCIPDNHMILRRPNEVCIADEREFSHYDDIHIIHQNINLKVARMLQIPFQTTRVLEKFQSCAFPFGQKEELVTRISNILKDYPKDTSILKELIQNADDAKASEVHFILDMREHGHAYMLGKEMADIQGPALSVFNDKCFTEKDLQGIVSLGIGSKQEDPSVTGKFGIGFNAVYHLTDAPSFLSVMPSGTEGNLVIFDPLCQYAPLAKPDNPGMMHNDISKLKTDFPDEYSKYFQNDQCPKEGTWFRFPLRKKMSAISNNTFNESGIIKLLEVLKKEMADILIFLRNVKKLKIVRVNAKNMVSDMYEIKAIVSPNDEVKKKEFFSRVNENSRLLQNSAKSITDLPYFSCTYKLDIYERSSDARQRYQIAQSFGCPAKFTVPQNVTDHINTKKIRLIPLGAVAFRCPDNRTMAFLKVQRNLAFCFLPLPIRTRLPVHVQGHFAVDYARSVIYLDTLYDERKAQWNHFLIDCVIARAYTELLKSFKNETTIKDLVKYHSIFPNYSTGSDGLSSLLACSVFRCIIEEEIPLFPIVHGNSLRWTELKTEIDHFPAFFDKYKTHDEESGLHTTIYSNVSSILKKLGMKLIDPPFDSVMTSMKEAEIIKEIPNDPRYLTPNDVLEFLNSWDKLFRDKCRISSLKCPVTESVFGNVENVKNLLDICLKDDNFGQNIEGLPLCVREDSIICCFSRLTPIFRSIYSDLLPNHGNEFLHRHLFTCFHNNNNGGVLKVLTMQDLARRMKENLPIFITNSDTPIRLDLERQALRWLIRFWRFMASIKDSSREIMIKTFGNLTLVPSQTEIYPFNKCFAILATEELYLEQYLEALELPFLLRSLQDDPLIHQFMNESIIATCNRPIDILECLVVNSEKIKSKEVSADDRNRIFEYFWYHRDELKSVLDLKGKISSLPFHCLIDGDRCSIPSKKNKVVLGNNWSNIPSIGMRKICEKHELVIILPKMSYALQWYTFLDTPTYSPKRLYKEFLMSGNASACLSDEELFAHLNWIREKKLYIDDEDEIMSDELKRLAFVPCVELGLRLKACHFYSPHNDICKQMCEKSELPPNPYDDEMWQDFMEKAGMQTSISEEKFLQFARKLEKEGSQFCVNEFPCHLRESSRKLLEHLFDNQSTYLKNKSFLENLKSIRCIIRYEIEQELANIHDVKEPDTVMICFDRSAFYRNKYLCWTELFVLPKYVNTAMNGIGHFEKEQVIKCLGIQDPVPSTTALYQLRNITTTLEPLYRQSFEKSNSALHQNTTVCKIMESLYGRLENENGDLMTRNIITTRTPVIHLEDNNLFLSPLQVVQTLEHPILPYLSSAPLYYGKYVELFKRFGCESNVTSIHYARVLMWIHEEIIKSGPCELLEPEVIKVTKAMDGLFRLLPEDCNWNVVSKLYLPTEKNLQNGKRLLLDTTDENLVVVDRPKLKTRLKHENIYFCCTLNEKNDINKLLERLPKRLKPQILSKLVIEKMNTICDISIETEKGRKLMQNLFSHQFITGLFRSLRHFHSADLSLEFDDVSNRVKSINIISLPQLETILVFRGNESESSITSTPCFHDHYDPDSIILYICENNSSWTLWIMSIAGDLIMLLEKILSMEFNAELKQTIEEMLTLEHTFEICTLLDQREIRHLGENIENNDDSVIGQYVPLRLHALLDNSFIHFENGEIAVYETYDPLIENMSSEEETGSVFIYVQIISKAQNSETKYIINNGEQHLEVNKVWLYKFSREKFSLDTEDDNAVEVKTSSSNKEIRGENDLEEVLKEIRKILKEAWTMDEKERKQILKRLHLRWHPDKNKHNVEFCTRVYQMFQWYLTKLEKGEDLEEDEKPKHKAQRHSEHSPKFYSNSYSSFFDNLRRRRGFHSTYDESDSAPRRPTPTYEPNPQPAVYDCWKRQAKHDFDTASWMLQATDGSDLRYNWICYILHQACEKALKAVIFKKDANKSSRSHCLTTLAYIVDKPGLTTLTRKLEADVVNDMRPRYPDQFWNYKIPSEEYDAIVARRVRTTCSQIFELLF